MQEETSQNKNKAWRIVCVKRKATLRPRSHVHIIGVGTGESSTWADIRWTLSQALAALKDGDTFYILDEDSGKHTEVTKTNCLVCNKAILSEPNTAAACLEDLRECKYDTDLEVNFSDS